MIQASWGVSLILSGEFLSSSLIGGHGAGDGRIEVADRLHALDGAEGGVGGDRVADLGHVHIDDVAQRVLRVVGDADGADGAFERDPFMLAGIAVICRDRPWGFSSLKIGDTPVYDQKRMRSEIGVRDRRPGVKRNSLSGTETGVGLSGTTNTISNMPAWKMGRLASAARTSASLAASQTMAAPATSPRFPDLAQQAGGIESLTRWASRAVSSGVKASGGNASVRRRERDRNCIGRL